MTRARETVTAGERACRRAIDARKISAASLTREIAAR
jgi:hypothetical protein